MKVRRGDIYMANLTEYEGSVQRGLRPVLVIQNDIGNDRSPTTIIAPISRGTRKHLHTHVWVREMEAGIDEESTVMLEQIRVINKDRLGDWIGRMPDYRMTQVDKAIQISLGLIEFEVRGGEKYVR